MYSLKKCTFWRLYSPGILSVKPKANPVALRITAFYSQLSITLWILDLGVKQSFLSYRTISSERNGLFGYSIFLKILDFYSLKILDFYSTLV